MSSSANAPICVSVILPTYNRAHTLGRAIDSVLGQTLSDWELIVIDDGSTDQTAALLDRIEHPRLRRITQANAGVSAARNRGIQAAQGQWIALLDSDDQWHANKLQRQLDDIQARPERLAHCEEIWIRHGVRVNPMKKHAKPDGWVFDACLPRCCISPSASLIKRELLDEVGLFDESLPACEDYDLWLRICHREPVRLLPEALLTKYGGHEDQLSQQYIGMDRFRVQSLDKLLELSTLSPSQRQNATEQLITKAERYARGARKHGHADTALHYFQLAEQHRQRLLAAQPHAHPDSES